MKQLIPVVERDAACRDVLVSHRLQRDARQT